MYFENIKYKNTFSNFFLEGYIYKMPVINKKYFMNLSFRSPKISNVTFRFVSNLYI